MSPAGVLCEVVSEDKTAMARLPELEEFADRARTAPHLDRRPHPLPAAQGQAGPADRRRQDPDRVRRVHRCTPTSRCSTESTTWHWSRATSTVRQNTLVRVHSECLTGDVFGSLRCDCGPQLQGALATDRRARERGARLPPWPRRTRDRARPQAARLPPPRGGARHGRRQPRARACRPTRVSTGSVRRSWSISVSPPCGS